MSTATLHLGDAACTEAAGARLAAELRGGMIVTLSGDLGAGKTTLARGCLRALGWRGSVKSPTYALVEHYEVSSLYFYHFDFYRFADPGEWEHLGFADYFRQDAICMIEWPERVDGMLPAPDLMLTLRYPVSGMQDGRELAMLSRSPAGDRCLSAIATRGSPVT